LRRRAPDERGPAGGSPLLLGFLAAQLVLATAVSAQPGVAGALDPQPFEPYVVERSRLESASGCSSDYTVYRPPDDPPRIAVLIVPGFARDQDRMRGWAEEFARRGHLAATMEFCSPTAFDGRHDENAADMIALRRALRVDAVVYVGHSAGGLAALLAATDDPAARGMLLLDPVDFAGRGRRVAEHATTPGLALLANPGVCNLHNNMKASLGRMPNTSVVAIEHASHCDFEWPPDPWCRALCDLGGPGRERRIASEREIRSLGADFVESIAARLLEARAADDAGSLR
jgi:hypothetical protein